MQALKRCSHECSSCSKPPQLQTWQLPLALQQSARTQHLLRLLILLKARRQLRSMNAARKPQQCEQLEAAPMQYCVQPLAASAVSHRPPA
jgi:hypothetical protein